MYGEGTKIRVPGDDRWLVLRIDSSEAEVDWMRLGGANVSAFDFMAVPTVDVARYRRGASWKATGCSVMYDGTGYVSRRETFGGFNESRMVDA